ncbi:hypothetical protein BJV77DRAFT_1010243, partial [Russula vinacea]
PYTVNANGDYGVYHVTDQLIVSFLNHQRYLGHPPAIPSNLNIIIYRIGVREPTAWRALSGEREPSVFLHVEAVEAYAGLDITSLEA